jgi:uncharacterized membrane protein
MNKVPVLMQRSRQRGAVLLFAAMGISALIVTASLIDLGLLYQYRREYQKTADLAAMAGAAQLFNGCTAATAAATTSVSRNLGSRNHDAPTISCGRWSPSPTPMFDDTPTADPRAMRVTVNGAPPGLLPFIPNRVIGATATAITDQPIAALTLRSSLLTVDTEQSAVLNSVVGGLLGGAINLSAGSWQGLLNTDVNLLSYMEALAVNLGLDALDHEGVLASSVTAGDLVNTAIDVLQDGGGTGDVGAGLAGLQSLALAIPGISPAIAVADLLAVETGAQAYALDTTLNLLQLVQASAQLSGGDAVIDITLPVSTGLVNATAKIRSVSAGQSFVIGNPELEELALSTQNLRAIISLDVGAAGTLNVVINELLSVAAPLLGPLTEFLNSTNLVSGLLNLVGNILSCVVGVCESRVVYIDALAQQIDIGVELSSGSAAVDDFNCGIGPKALNIEALASVGTLGIGRFAGNDSLNAAGALSEPDPVGVLELGYKNSRRSCLVFCGATEWEQPNGTWSSAVGARNTAKRYVLAGVGIRFANAPLGGGFSALEFVDAPPVSRLPDLGELPEYQSLNVNENVVGGLQSTLGAIEVQPYTMESGLLANVLVGTLSFPSEVIVALQDQIEDVLAPLLDPVLNALLATLGAQLAQTEVGANLTCSAGGATLVR